MNASSMFVGVVEDEVLGQVQGDLGALIEVRVPVVQHLEDHLFVHPILLRRGRARGHSVPAPVAGHRPSEELHFLFCRDDGPVSRPPVRIWPWGA